MKLSGPFALPKVSILTPTRNRPGFLKQCAKYVERQTYTKELLEWVIVDAGDEPIFIPDVAREDMRVQILTQKGSVGTLRNLGNQIAWGDIIVHFDDDDWHAPDRVERQVAALLAWPSVDLVCTEDYHVLLASEKEPRAMPSWSWGLETFSSGGTFAYRKNLWKKRSFVNMMTGEDQVFAKWARLDRFDSARNLRDPGIFVCVRHGSNTCTFEQDVADQATTGNADWICDLMGRSDYGQTLALAKASVKQL